MVHKSTLLQSGSGGGSLTLTDGVHSVADVTQITVSGGTVGGSTPDATLTITGSGTPGGSNTQVQYNNSGAFGGITGATTDGTTLTLVAPVLGTPASGTLTNCDGTASSLTAGHVTNATFTTALTVNTGTLTLTANSANTSVLTIGAGAVSVSGSNTGDQTITLTGAVTGSGTGSFATTIATPGTLTVSSTNSTATAHTHAITSSSAPGAAASILATDSSGIIGSTGTRIVKGWFTDLTVTNAIAASITGSAPTLTTARAIYGNNFDGSAALTQVIASTYGGTGNGFAKLSGPATSEKTFTLPNASATILTDNAAVTTAQGGTGQNFGSSTGFVTVASGTASCAEIPFGFAVNTNSITTDGTYALVVYAPCAGTVTAIKQISSNSGGTVTANFKINTTSITGLSSISVTSTAQDVSASGANTFSVGDAIKLTTTSSTSLTNLQFLILCTRTA